MKQQLLASSILQNLAEDQSLTVDERYTFVLASKEAYHTACRTADYTESLESKRCEEELDNLECQLLKDKEEEHRSAVLQDAEFFESLWKKFDFLAILSFLNDSICSTVSRANACLEAFKLFLQNKEPYWSSKALIFFKAVLKLKEEKVISALADLESVAWNCLLPEWTLGPIMCIFSNFQSLYSFEPLKKFLQSGSLFSKPIDTSLKERSISILFPSDEELTPPFKINWVSQFNSECFQFEEAVVKLFNERKWSNYQVAGAYIDKASTCKHPAEIVICHLHAAMWITRNFKAESVIEPNVLFAFKSILMRLLSLSYERTLHALNPGMHLHVIRLALGIVRKTAMVPGSQLVFTAEDVSLLQKMLHQLLKVCHMFPFWKPPSVSLSEAATLDIVTKKLHSNFLLELQCLKPENWPLTYLELTYWLYHNDICGILPLENSSGCRVRAMGELLKSQGLSWNNVRQTMSTQLCLRDENGWIIQAPHLGKPLQFIKVTGFIFDADRDHPSLELLVVEADPKNRKKGLFSLEDINTMLQLDLNDMPLLFSLDPPSDDFDKVYHPFQQLRFTEKIADTEVLETMFNADYFMKSLATDSEISSRPPFKQRPCKHGLIKNLPPKLQEKIRPINERRKKIKSYSYQFYIKQKKIKYKLKKSGTRYEYRFGEVEMKVKSHSFSQGTRTLCKDDNDPNSPHATFARDMTEGYSELGEYFPEFKRLQELSKLQLVSEKLQVVVQNIAARCPEQAAQLTNFMKTFKQPLTSSAQQCKWVPAAISPNQTLTYGGVEFCKNACPMDRLERPPQYENETAVFISSCKTAPEQAEPVIYLTPTGTAEKESSGGDYSWFHTSPVTDDQLQSLHDSSQSAQTVRNGLSRYSSLPIGGRWKQESSKFITGCDGDGSLFNTIKDPADILNPSSLPRVVTPYSGVRSCKEVIDGVYILHNKDTEEKFVGHSSDVFQRIGQHIKDIQGGRSKLANFFPSTDKLEGCVLNIPPSDRKNVLKNLCADFGPRLINNRLHPGGVKFCENSEHVQDGEILDLLQHENETKALIRPMTTTPPTDVGGGNETGNDSSFFGSPTQPRVIMEKPQCSRTAMSQTVKVSQILHSIMNSSAKQPVSSSSFKQKNSPKLNKQLDRLRHSVIMRQSQYEVEIPQLTVIPWMVYSLKLLIRNLLVE